jgi:RND family efflux transporter MFP subunit
VIVVLLNVYLVILFLLVKLKIVRFNLFWKTSPVIVFLALLIGLFIPMNWGAPQGPALVLRNSVAIVPSVAGEVAEVPVEANAPLKAGDILFKIDPVPYEAQLRALEAQLKFQELRLGQMEQLQSTGTGRTFDVEQRQAEVDQLKGQVENARWNLDKTVVRAPADGYVTNLALRKGARVANLPLSPVMAFIDVSDTIIGVEIPQIDARYIKPGQAVEATFKYAPGKVYPGKVETVLQAVASGQVQTSGSAAMTSKSVAAAPFVVRIRLDDKAFADGLPAGTAGDVAIFTDRVKPAHMIRKVLLRQIAITNYINPF